MWDQHTVNFLPNHVSEVVIRTNSNQCYLPNHIQCTMNYMYSVHCDMICRAHFQKAVKSIINNFEASLKNPHRVRFVVTFWNGWIYHYCTLFPFWGMLGSLGKLTINLAPVHPSDHINLTSTGQVFVKFDTGDFHLNLSWKFQFGYKWTQVWGT